MSNLLLVLIILIGVAAHEFGHWIYIYSVTKKLPKINITWFGISVGDRKELSHFTLKQEILMLSCGVILGLPFFIWNGNILFLLYLLMSSGDIFTIMTITEIKKEYKLKLSTKIEDIPCERCKHIAKLNGDLPVEKFVLNNETN